jgi:DNA-binding CsgD family transcriptional regulator
VKVSAQATLRVLELANQAHEIGDRNAGLVHALSGICDLVGADTSFMFMFDTADASVPQESMVHGYDRKSAPQVLARYINEGDRFDLLAAHVRTAYDGHAPVMARRRQALIDDRRWYRSMYLNEFRRPWGFDHSIYSIQRLGTQRVGMSVSRAFGARQFTTEDQALIEIFHLAIERVIARASPAANSSGNESVRASLPPRARDTLDQLLRGASNKDIAAQLRISPNTVHHYCKMLFRAYGVRSRGELLARWLIP